MTLGRTSRLRCRAISRVMSGRCGGAQRARARLPIRRCAGRRPRAQRVQPPRAACAAIDSGAHGRCQCRPCRGASPTAHRMAPWERCRAVTYSPARTPLHAAGHAAGHECSPPASAPGCAPRRLRRPCQGRVIGRCGVGALRLVCSVQAAGKADASVAGPTPRSTPRPNARPARSARPTRPT